ncbi:MAG: DUF2007 domain-containing protein [Ignavibacteriae bacterium]|nr:DUF2007 domain-containing protein [Ignavibacteriota bacterium]NOH00129.1 DUF2007 domain-containing protein [Ignavibacteriota bacterium]
MSERLVKIASYNHETDAALAQALLKDYEIESFLYDNNIGNLYSGIVGLYGGIKLHVAETDAEHAIKLLKESGDSNFSTSENVIPPCPNCGSANTKYSKFTSILVFVFTGLFMSNYPYTNRKIECMKCGHKWKA